MVYKMNESIIVIQAEAINPIQTKVVFWSHDRGTAKLRMKLVQKDGIPQSLPEGTTVPIRLIFRSATAEDGYGKHDYLATVEDPVNGIVFIVLEDNILGYVGKVEGSVYIDFPNDRSLDTAGRFTFYIKRSPIDDSTPELEDYYFNGFSQTIDKIEKILADGKQEIEQKITESETQIDAKVKDTNDKITKANQDVATINTNIDKANDRIDQTNQQIAAVLTDVNEFRTDIDTLKINKADKTFVDAQLAENTSQMLKSYGLLFDGTDTLATLQSALTDIASKYSSVKFPHKAIFNITNTLYIPAGLTVDFNGAVFTSTNDIDFDSIVIAGSNVHVKNLKIVEAGHAYLSDADGLAISGAANIENVTIENVTTEGFENGIAVKTDTGFLASNINILNCNTSYGASAGLSVSNARNVVITNHNATHNALDGLEISQNTNYIKVSGGYFGYNVNPIDGYADGIDLYAGSPYIIVDGAVCDYNGGVGIHLLSGELNDPLYVGYVGNAEKNIIVVNCITRNNVVSGIDILSKVTVSATTPHPSKILISNSISEGNEYGIIMKARHVTVSGCITTGNKKYGITVAQSRYIILADNHVIANSKLSAGAYPGIYISASAYMQVDKGIINGADSDSLQDGNESALTIWHVHGIEINGADTCDNIFIDTPIITNYTGFRQVNVSNTAANPNKKIIIKLGDIGNDTTDSYYGYYGSVFYKNNRLYEKNTDLSSTAWVPKPIEKFGITDFTATAPRLRDSPYKI